MSIPSFISGTGTADKMATMQQRNCSVEGATESAPGSISGDFCLHSDQAGNEHAMKILTADASEENVRLSKAATSRTALHLAKLSNELLIQELEEKNRALSAQAAALRESDEKFRQLADTITEVCWIASADEPMELLYVSPKCEKVFGRNCQSFIDNPESIYEIIAPADGPRVAAGMAALRRGEKLDLEHQIIHPNGQVRWVHARGSAVRDESGRIYRLAGTIEDITARKCTEDQLRQSQKMEAIGQLAGGVAHDFNNLLTIIGGNVELMLMTQESLPAEAKDYLHDIANAAARAEGLTRQLLSFSRREAMAVQVLNLNKLVAGFSKLLRRVLGESIVVRNELASDLPGIKADSGMMEQILMNLAVNARDAMPAGGQLIIRTEVQNVGADQAASQRGAREGKFVCLIVNDMGTGIAPELLAHIFEPFFTTKGAGKGTGLGLATVFGIAEQHHGWVTVSSQVGVGTTFRVYFPATAEKVLPSDTAIFKKSADGCETVLVAEDDAALLRVMTDILRRRGYNVLEANSAIAARQAWVEHNGKIDLLVTDVIMSGGVTGLELAELLRLEKPELKVILTSGYSSELMSAESAALKKLTFLRKPFAPQKLADAIRHCLDATNGVN